MLNSFSLDSSNSYARQSTEREPHYDDQAQKSATHKGCRMSQKRNDETQPAGTRTTAMRSSSLPRRDFLKLAAGTVGAVAPAAAWSPTAHAQASQEQSQTKPPHSARVSHLPADGVSYPRAFQGSGLKMISFPLGGIGAGSLGLGGRGQLRDWEIFNRPNKGFSPNYAFPAIWAQVGDAPPAVHVLESRILPPYEGEDGLGWENAPGLSRLKSCTFTGEYPLAHIDFDEPTLPVHISLDAFSPFIPHEPDDSGLPVAILRYHIRNSGEAPAKVGIVFSIDNPVLNGTTGMFASGGMQESRVNEYRSAAELAGLLMTNPGLPEDDPVQGSFLLAALPQSGTQLTNWRGWPKGSWWNSPLLFWDAFSRNGKLDDEPAERNGVGALCQSRTIAPGQSGSFTFVLAWHFPNRTPEWCGWRAPKGKDKAVIGNFYSTRFKNAWDAAIYAAQNLDRLENRTRAFAKAFRESTLPAAVKEAASANLSTLASTTCFRTADGEFHGFEGSNDKLGCCYGNCTHVWNYETATAFLFPTLARSLRQAAFGYSEDEQGGIRARQMLPDGEARDEIIAADGHWGQIMHAYLDWRLSGDDAFLRSMWPRVRRAISFAWVQGGWDPEKSGVAVGVQNNTYDVAFFGPNPLCGIYYLGGLRAGEEMALAAGDKESAQEYRALFERGRQWTDQNLFSGEFYTQQIRSFTMDQIHPSLQIGASGFKPDDPQFQVGKGCLIDQLMGQYLAHVMGLGPLVSPQHVRQTLDSIYRYNYKRSLLDHDNVERTFALNDEAAMVICDYGHVPRPHIPFPYFAEVMTGFEHSTAALMIYSGLVSQGVECIGNIRARYDGERRNPWDEAECGHHYARAMASWSSVVAASGWDYDAKRAALSALPRVAHEHFTCFWSNGTGWGVFSYEPLGNGTRFDVKVISGKLACQTCEISGAGKTTAAESQGKHLAHTASSTDGGLNFKFAQPLLLNAGESLRLEVRP